MFQSELITVGFVGKSVQTNVVAPYTCLLCGRPLTTKYYPDNPREVIIRTRPVEYDWVCEWGDDSVYTFISHLGIPYSLNNEGNFQEGLLPMDLSEYPIKDPWHNSFTDD